MTESLCIAVSSSFPEKNPNVINVFQNVSKNVSYFHFLYFFGGNKHICKWERCRAQEKFDLWVVTLTIPHALQRYKLQCTLLWITSRITESSQIWQQQLAEGETRRKLRKLRSMTFLFLLGELLKQLFCTFKNTVKISNFDCLYCKNWPSNFLLWKAPLQKPCKTRKLQNWLKHYSNKTRN